VQPNQCGPDPERLRARFKEVKASRGKVVRAEPVAALYEQGKVHHVGAFPALEDEMIAFTSPWIHGRRQPRSRDALIWGLIELFPRVVVASHDTGEPVTVSGGPLMHCRR
jgi:phage terminase large subunit-like protein